VGLDRLNGFLCCLASLACLAYFIFGKNDFVGVLNNLFPCGVAAYNLSLEVGAQTFNADQPARAANPAMTSVLHAERQWRRMADLRRWVRK